MLSKNKIKVINQLKQKKYRQQLNLFIAEGSRNTLDFIKNGIQLDDLFITEEWKNEHQTELAEANYTIVTQKELKKISALTNPSEVIGIFRLPNQSKSTNIDTETLSLILDNIHDPGNLGTIIRTADWFGIKTIYCSSNTVDAYNPKVVQASMGSLSRVNVIYCDLSELLSKTSDNYTIMGAFLDGEPVNKLKPIKSGAIIIGSEAHGISKEIQPLINKRITIPMENTGDNKPESLNASIACAVICYALKISN